MKVAISINTSWNILNFRSGIVKELIKEGHEVYTIAPFDDSTTKLKDMGCKCYHVDLENTGMNVISDYRYYKQFLKTLKEIKPDALLSYTIKPNIYGTIACGKLNIPVINNVSGLGTAFLWNKALKSLVIKLYKYAFKRSSHIFFQNDHDQKLFLDEINIPINKTSVIPGSGVNTTFFKPSELSVSKTSFTFLMISRLLIDKGIEEYCEAASLLKKLNINARFQILGKPEDSHKRGYSKEKIDELSKNNIIEYLGTTKDVRSFIETCDCIVLPSYREGTSKTLLEAASMGKPMIATNVPGCNNIVEHGVNGLLCDVRSTDSLKNALLKVYQLDQKTLDDYGYNSRLKAIEKFDEQIVIRKYFKKIEEITSERIKKTYLKEEVYV